MSMKRYLFSYGTLLPNRAPAEIAPVVRRLRRVGRGRVHGRLYDLGEYPGAVLSKSGPVIAGEIFELPDDPDVLEKLDQYEGFDPAREQGSLFVRKKRLVNIDNGKESGAGFTSTTVTRVMPQVWRGEIFLNSDHVDSLLSCLVPPSPSRPASSFDSPAESFSLVSAP